MKLKNQIVLLLASLSLLFLFSCSEKELPTTNEEEARGSKGTHGEWSYEGETGPVHWGSLSPDYIMADIGREQSPINIDRSKTILADLPKIIYNYGKSYVHFINNGHTVQANLKNGLNSITIGDKKYTLAQFHFHTQSENTLDGRHAPVEMHLVHKADDGNLAVVGVFFVDGEENKTLKKLWDNMPDLDDTTGYHSGEKVKIKKLIPQNHTCYRFDGSLTTPPCTEGVKWTVMATPLEMSTRQINKFFDIFSGHQFPEGNRRPVQPLNERKVVLDIDHSDDCDDDHDDDDDIINTDED